MPASCLCGFVRESPTERSPLRYDEHLGQYYLELSPSLVIRDAKCLFCGGQDRWAENLKRCSCNSVEQWAEMDAIPVYRDTGNGLYMLSGEKRSDGKEVHWAIWFCPACGGRISDEVGSDHDV